MYKIINNAFLILMLLFSALTQAKDCNVLDYGAKANGQTLDTQAVQAAIDLCTKEVGGRVLIPSGKVVLIGTIYLKNFVTLYLENGAVLLGCPNYGDVFVNRKKIK